MKHTNILKFSLVFILLVSLTQSTLSVEEAKNLKNPIKWVQNKINTNNAPVNNTQLQIDIGEAKIKELKAKEKLDKHVTECENKRRELENKYKEAMQETEKINAKLNQNQAPNQVQTFPKNYTEKIDNDEL